MARCLVACLKPQVVRPGGATKRPRLSTSLASTVYGRLRWCQLAVCTYVSRVQQPCGRVITSYVRSSDVPPPRTDIPTHHLLWCVCSSHLVPGTTGHLCCHRNTQGRKRYQVPGKRLLVTTRMESPFRTAVSFWGQLGTKYLEFECLVPKTGLGF